MIEAYRTDNTDYTKNGDMPLLPIDAKVNVELNGTWVLELEHPIDDEGRWKYLEEEAVVKCPSFNGDQLFRIKSIEKNDDSVFVKAYPIFFDSKDDCFLTDIRPTGKNGQEALNIMLAPNKKYSAQSDIPRRATAYYEYMNLIESINGDNANSFLNRWGGEILYDNFKIIVNERVGGDYGVELRYGKNIPANGITETVDMSEVVTRIYPKSYNGYKLSGNGYVDSPILSNYPTVKAATIKFDNIKMREDAQEDDEEKGVVICDTQADLDRALTEACKRQFESGLDKPKVTIEADMVLLQNTDQYKDYEILETVSLGDTIHCRHDKLGIISDARVVGLEYDCILNRVTSVVLGQFQSNYIDNIASSIDKIDSVIDSDGDIMAERVKGILDGITTQLRLQSTVAKKVKGRAFIAEDLDPNSPLYGCIAWGTQGIEIANKRTIDGRDWDWSTAMTANGIVANAIISGLLADKTGQNFWDLDKGIFKISSRALNVDDKTVGQIAQEEADRLLTAYAETITKDIENLQTQIDGQVEDWYYDYEPTLENIPASDWETDEEKKKHIGDRFYWKSMGYAYYFSENAGTFCWEILKDKDIVNALKSANEAKDVADGKRRTFITQPMPPYDIGDMWANGIDILTCIVPKPKESAYELADWKKLQTYTDDKKAEEAIKDAENAAKTATDFMQFDKKGLQIGNNQTGTFAGYLTRITGNSLEILDESEKVVAAFQVDAIDLGKDSINTIIRFCGAKGNIWYNAAEDFFQIESKRLRNRATELASLYTISGNARSGYNAYTDRLEMYAYNAQNVGSQAFLNSQNAEFYLKGKMIISAPGGLDYNPGVSKVLYEGCAWMDNTSNVINFPRPITSLMTGIVLVFSLNENGSPTEWAYSSHFIPKYLLQDLGERTYSFVLSAETFNLVGVKFLHISNTRIVGHGSNNGHGTKNGITYDNRRWALRRVYGV